MANGIRKFRQQIWELKKIRACPDKADLISVRARESGHPGSHGECAKVWVPAFAGTNGKLIQPFRNSLYWISESGWIASTGPLVPKAVRVGVVLAERPRFKAFSCSTTMDVR